MWTAFLAGEQPNRHEDLLVFMSRRAATQGALLRDAARGYERSAWRVHFVECPDELEVGYPKSPSHLFLRILEHCEKHHAGRGIAFNEPDTVATRPGWFTEIADEYEACDRPFMGQRILHPRGGGQHLMGNSVYTAEWRKRAPSLATVLDAPDTHLWGEGKGQPWDVWAGRETTQDMHESGLYQQIFTGPPFTAENLNRLRPGAALFHRSKDGTLISQLARRDQPGFRDTLPPASRRFVLNGHPSRLRTIGHTIEGWRVVKRPTGWMAIIQPTDPLDELVLGNLCGSCGVSAISQQDFEQLERKSAAA